MQEVQCTTKMRNLAGVCKYAGTLIYAHTYKDDTRAGTAEGYYGGGYLEGS